MLVATHLPEPDVSVLFSEPKIPQLNVGRKQRLRRGEFQCSSASRKFLNCLPRRRRKSGRCAFQCSSASRKFLNVFGRKRAKDRVPFQCSSASRKFLNIVPASRHKPIPEFQCSSASRKFLNFRMSVIDGAVNAFQCSSASRKFLNGINGALLSSALRFQCSSASRKFLNTVGTVEYDIRKRGFSALQRAENSSIGDGDGGDDTLLGFSALQRAENSSMIGAATAYLADKEFQCSSASRKFLNEEIELWCGVRGDVSVLFSEPKIPQSPSSLF